MRAKILILGLGSVGRNALEILARTPRICEIVAGDIDEDFGVRATNNALLGAAQQGMYPHIEFRRVNVSDVQETANMLRDISPDLIINSTSLLSPRKVRESLSRDQYHQLLMTFGSVLPVHLALTYGLMRAVREAKIRPHVINTPFPDVTNHVLAKVNLHPTIGIGNTDLLTPCLQKLVSDKLRVPMRNVCIYLVAAHHLWHHLAYEGTANQIPFFLKIVAEGRNVTSQFNSKELLTDVSRRLPRPTGATESFIRGLHTAASAVRNALAILDDTGELVNSPGPNGLPGAYPTRLSKEGAEVVLPEEITLRDAIRINEETNRLDGIEVVKEDGTVVFTDKCVDVTKRVLGYECREMPLDDVEKRANEINALFEDLLQKQRPGENT